MSSSAQRSAVIAIILALLLYSTQAQPQPSCKQCLDVVDALEVVINADTKVGDIEFFANAACLLLEVEPLEVCLGIMHEFVPLFKYVITQRPLSQAMCADLRYCTPYGEEPQEPLRNAFMWRDRLHVIRARVGAEQGRNAPNIHHSKASSLLPLKKVDDPTIGYTFHISDIHYDPDYIPGTDVNCGYPLCCHGGTGDAAPFGSYGCDAPLILLHSVFAAMTKILPDPDYIIFTGDVPPHNVWNQSIPYNLNASVTASGVLKQYFPKTQILYAIGNHEVYPVDQDLGPGNNTWYTQGLQPLWLDWITGAELSTWSNAAYYTTLLSPGVRVVSLDTNYCAFQNFILTLSSVNSMYDDLGQQLAWVNSTLAAAQAVGEKVWLLGHIPLGDYACLDSYASSMYDVLSQYPGVVTAAFMGHTHWDQFSVLRSNDTQQTPFLPVYIAPAITPESGNNPSFRVYEYNRTTGEILDYVQYIGNLSDITSNGPTWQIEYSAKSRFAMPDLSAQSWANLATLLTNNVTAMTSYCDLWYTGRGVDAGCGNADVDAHIACSFFAINISDYTTCVSQRRSQKMK